jgi:hypothetical protein
MSWVSLHSCLLWKIKLSNFLVDPPVVLFGTSVILPALATPSSAPQASSMEQIPAMSPTTAPSALPGHVQPPLPTQTSTPSTYGAVFAIDGQQYTAIRQTDDSYRINEYVVSKSMQSSIQFHGKSVKIDTNGRLLVHDETFTPSVLRSNHENGQPSTRSTTEGKGGIAKESISKDMKAFPYSNTDLKSTPYVIGGSEETPKASAAAIRTPVVDALMTVILGEMLLFMDFRHILFF